MNKIFILLPVCGLFLRRLPMKEDFMVYYKPHTPCRGGTVVDCA